MTSTVSRGTTRPTAAQRTAKAAQRNPLTAALKGAALDQEVDAIVEAAIKKVRTSRTKVATPAVEPEPAAEVVVEKPKRARLSGAARKSARSDKDTAARLAATAAEKPSATGEPTPAVKVAEDTTTVPERPAKVKADKEPKPSKATLLGIEAEKAGWAALITALRARETVDITRETERLIVTFLDNKLDLSAMPVFVRSDGSKVLLRNASAVRKQMAADPADRPVRSERRAPKTAVHVSSADQKPIRLLPFDSRIATDATVVETFRRGVRVVTRSAAVGKPSREFTVPPRTPVTVAEPKSKVGPEFRTVTFMNVEGKTCSVALDRVTRIDVMTKAEADDATHALKAAYQKR
jgi:hypothetical protein